MDIIRPKSVVKLIHATKRTPVWLGKIGKICRVGYYSKLDGLEIIWLVDETGYYCETTDQHDFLKYFTVIKPGPTDDFYGDNAPRLRKIAKPAKDWLWSGTKKPSKPKKIVFGTK